MQSQAASGRVRKLRQPALQQICEYASGAKAEQSDRNGEKSEVIKEDDREQSRQRQFEKQCGKTGERETRKQSFFRDFRRDLVGMGVGAITAIIGLGGRQSSR